MTELLGLVLISFICTSLLLVPFIDGLFFLKRKFEKVRFEESNKSVNPITDKLMKGDESTPSGGGILLIIVLSVLSLFYYIFNNSDKNSTLIVLLITLLTFGMLGLMDDIKWLTTKRKGKLLGLGRKVLLLIQIGLALMVGSLLYYYIGITNFYISGVGNFIVGIWYIPIAAFLIVSFANAYNISDGLDGLSTGLLTICLFAYLVLANSVFNASLSAFVGIWIGTLIAYLYFNVWPARIYLGDAGAFGFGATLAVVGLLTGKIIGLTVIGGVYIIIVASSLLQILSKRFLKRKLLPVAPIHMYFKYIGWEEPKIVMRFWLAGAIFAITGLWLSLLSK
jgi:phospho-N-acetylmuramoyl-pentapeptide-transferase